MFFEMYMCENTLFEIYNKNLGDIIVSRFHQDTVGMYSIYSAVTDYDFTRADIEKGEEFFDIIPSKDASFHGMRLKSGVKIDQFNDFFPLLVFFHERVHHNQIFSSVYGLLLWRLHRQIHTKMGFIIRKLRESDVQQEAFLPLFDWYKSSSFKLIKTANPNPDKSFIAVLEKLFGISEDQYNGFYANNIEQNFRDLDLLRTFLDLIQNCDIPN